MHEALGDLPFDVIIIMDQEAAITQSIAMMKPSLPRFLCWNHVQQDCRCWLHNYGVTNSTEMAYYLDCFRQLLGCESEAAYKDLLIHFLSKWSKPFSKYFTTHIHKVIEHLGASNLRRFGVESVTTNASESFNCVLKRLQECSG